MSEKKLDTLINGSRNDFKIVVDDLFNVLEIISEDIERLKKENPEQDEN